jgi:hypothetical protein
MVPVCKLKVWHTRRKMWRTWQLSRTRYSSTSAASKPPIPSQMPTCNGFATPTAKILKRRGRRGEPGTTRRSNATIDETSPREPRHSQCGGLSLLANERSLVPLRTYGLSTVRSSGRSTVPWFGAFDGALVGTFDGALVGTFDHLRLRSDFAVFVTWFRHVASPRSARVQSHDAAKERVV